MNPFDGMRRMRRVILLAIVLMLVAGCGGRLRRTEEVIHQDSVIFEQLTCNPKLRDGHLCLRFEQVFSAEQETIRHYQRNNGLIFLEIPIGIATLGQVSVLDYTETDGPKRKHFRQPLTDGTPVSGYLRVVSQETGRERLRKPVASNTSQSEISIPMSNATRECLAVSFEGEVFTLGRQVPAKMEIETLCP